MPERLTPGVYIEEVSSGVKPIQGVGTSTAAFIGEAVRGIPDRATFVTGFRDYERLFGGHRRGEAGFLAQSVEAFFDAGGRRAYVVRVLPGNATRGLSASSIARAADAWGLRRQVISFQAKGNGIWSSHIRIHIEQSTAFQDVAFKVRVEWTEGGRSRTVETFDNVRMDPEHEDYVVEIINDTSKYIEAIDHFVTDFLDAEERTQPPIPEQVAALQTRPEEDGSYRIPLNAKFLFSWNDSLSSGGTDPEEPVEVEITSAAVAAAGGSVSGDDAVLNAVQLRDLLQSQLNDSETQFRISIPLQPASLTSEEGPFDLSASANIQFSIDEGATTTVNLVQMTPALIDAGSGPFTVSEGDDVQLTVNGTQTVYTLGTTVADEVTDDAATVAQLVEVINREFTGIQAFPDPGDGSLIIRTDAIGSSASLAWALVSGGAPVESDTDSGAGNVARLTAVSAQEVATAFNTGAGAAFEARVDGNRVEFIQTDLTADHSVRWVAPVAVVADTTLQTGPHAPAIANVSIEPLVASAAYISVQLQQGADELDVTANNSITLRLTSDATVENYVVDVSGDTAITMSDLASRINTALGSNDFNVAVDAAGSFLVALAPANSDGVALELLVTPGDAPWRSLVTIAGSDGLIVEAQNAVEIKVAEELQLGVDRVLSRLFGTVSGKGLSENSSANPNLRPAVTGDSPIRLLGGGDGSGIIGLSQYRGGETERTGLHAFDTVDINMLCIPGKNGPGFLSSAMGYCEAHNVFFISDGPGSIDRRFEVDASTVSDFIQGLSSRSKNSAMYYPWLEVNDPVGVGRNPKRFVPPSGHMAGVFARTDLSRGVWKSPAGIEATVPGVMDLQHDLVDADQDLLNPIGLNCVRKFPNTGIVVWGARTLSSDPEWRYVAVRRTALFLKESLRRGLKWVVFEPNDQELWDRIRININAFMLGLFRQRAFQGATPAEAFLVKCDRETNPQELIDQGIVTAQVAFAPLKPAEFVVIQISQKALVA